MHTDTTLTPHTSTDTLVRKGYHHGNLNEALLLSARALLEEEGLSSLSLRAVARKAGVSHNAPYHHFNNKADLIAEVAKRGFEDLALAMTQEAEKSSPTAHDLRLIGVGRAYIHFALTHPALFSIMFHPEWTKPASFPSLKTSMQAAFTVLLNEVESAVKSNALKVTNSRQAALGAWSLVHGFSTLFNEKAMAETQLGTLDQEELVAMALTSAAHAIGLPS